MTHATLETIQANQRILETLVYDLLEDRQTKKSLTAIQKTFQFDIKGFSSLKKAEMYNAILEGAQRRLAKVTSLAERMTEAMKSTKKVHSFQEMYAPVSRQVTRRKATGFGSK